MIEMLCDDSTSCKEWVIIMVTTVSDNDKRFNMTIKTMRISLDHFI